MKNQVDYIAEKGKDGRTKVRVLVNVIYSSEMFCP